MLIQLATAPHHDSPDWLAESRYISLIQLATAPHHDSPDWLVESRYISLAGKDVRRRQDATKNRA